MRKKNSKRALSPSISFVQSYHRKRVETAGSLIAQLLPKSIHAVTSQGFELKVRGRRRWAASEALELGHGGIQVVAQATGLGERTIRRGCEELRHEQALASPASRRIR